MPLPLAFIQEKCHILAQRVIDNTSEVTTILKEYESKHVAEYEIARVLYTLSNIQVNADHFNYKVSSLGTFLPSNLPFYSLILFGIVPSFQITQKLYLKPNQEMRDKKIVQRLDQLLGISSLFENIEIVDIDSGQFIEKCIKQSEVVIFTGYQKTKDKILQQLPNNSLLLFNGAGHNPFVIAEDADLDKAVHDAVYTRYFNTGQDCAGPDSILVHRRVSQRFKTLFIEQTQKLVVSNSYMNEATDIGPIHRLSELQKFMQVIHAVNPEHILLGGVIDVRNRLVHPTVISSHITEDINWSEMFGPIAFIHEYDDDEQLHLYFEDKNGYYQAHKMYVSLYGTSPYISSKNDELLTDHAGVGIVLHNMTIHDYERGDRAYGGYSLGASGFTFKNEKGHYQSHAQPIYVPEALAQFAKNKLVSQQDKSKQVAKIYKKKVRELFGDNLEFAFIYGSVAKNTARFNTVDASDLDTFVCLKENHPQQEKEYKRWLVAFQWELGLKPDFDYPTELVTVTQLDNNLAQARQRALSFSYNDETMFDTVVWLDALLSDKIAIQGNFQLLGAFSVKARDVGDHFRQTILNHLIINLPTRMSLATGYIKKAADFSDAKQKLMTSHRSKDTLFFIKKNIPLGGSEVTSKSRDDQSLGVEEYYKKTEQQIGARMV